ncbi:NUDIX hydrolase [Agromyces archimandritae]|uniref:NUDIX hydrolase n=1 Tax=Agromyces archimandritae TaxID=2781962 RepID=UPI003CC7F2D0
MSAASARAQLEGLIGDRTIFDRWPERTAGGERPAAVLVLFGVLDGHPADRDAQARAVSRDLDVLLLARAATLSTHAGQVAFPGGRLEPADRGPVDAALREANEETGLDPEGVEVLGMLPELPMPYSRHIVTPVLGWWASQSPVRAVDAAESAAVFRTPVAELLDPDNRYTSVLRRGGRTMRGPAWLVGPESRHVLWGFTAGILDAVFDRLGWAEDWDRTRELDLEG